MKEKKRFIKGMRDVQMLFDHLDTEAKKARRAAWIKEKYSKERIPKDESTTNTET